MDESFELKLKEVKERVLQASDYSNYYDNMFKRFLIGHKLVVENAVNGLIAAGEFRKEYRADTLTESDCKTYHDRRVTFIYGYDKKGQPLLNCIAGRHDRLDRDIEEVRLFIIYMIDKILKLTNPETEKVAIIFDLSSFSMQCMDFEVTKLLVHTLQTYYPEILGNAFIVGAPFIFRACWQIIRPWLDPVTAAKVQFITGSQLTNYVDIENLCDEFRANFNLGDSSVSSRKSEPPPFTQSDAEQVESEISTEIAEGVDD